MDEGSLYQLTQEQLSKFPEIWINSIDAAVSTFEENSNGLISKDKLVFEWVGGTPNDAYSVFRISPGEDIKAIMKPLNFLFIKKDKVTQNLKRDSALEDAFPEEMTMIDAANIVFVVFDDLKGLHVIRSIAEETMIKGVNALRSRFLGSSEEKQQSQIEPQDMEAIRLVSIINSCTLFVPGELRMIMRSLQIPIEMQGYKFQRFKSYSARNLRQEIGIVAKSCIYIEK